MDREIHAIITGDIVRSEAIGLHKRNDLLKTLRHALEELQRHSPMRMEIYRGDSFQIIADNPAKSLRIASMIRAYLIGNAPEDEKNGLDVRLSYMGCCLMLYVSPETCIHLNRDFHCKMDTNQQ